MIITGIGNRRITPDDVFRIEEFCNKYSSGNTLRSGEADGSDFYFRKFWQGDMMELYLPWDDFNKNKRTDVIEKFTHTITPEQVTVCKDIIHKHGIEYLGNRKQSVINLKTRNVLQVLGKDINTKSDLVVYCAELTTNGSVSGGTRTAVDLAKKLGIPTYNLKYGIPDIPELER